MNKVTLMILFAVFCTFSGIHNNMRLTQVHSPFRWVFADSAARVAESVTTSDTDKVAYQKSDSSIWVLRDNDPKTWIELNNNFGNLFADSVESRAGNYDTIYTSCLEASDFSDAMDTSFSAYCTLYEDAVYVARGLCYFYINYIDSTISISGPQITGAFSSSGYARLRNPNIKDSRVSNSIIFAMVYDDLNEEPGYIMIGDGYLRIYDLSINGTDGIFRFNIKYRF
jgi:hypothetical protein